MYIRRGLVSFLLVGLSLPVYVFSIPLEGVLKTVLQILSNVFFWFGIVVMGTWESGKVRELRTLTSIKDCLIGNIPNKSVTKRIIESRIEQTLFFLSSSVLVLVAIINYFYYNGELSESAAMFITGIIFVAYYLTHRRA
jgi:hypothetical protein